MPAKRPSRAPQRPRPGPVVEQGERLQKIMARAGVASRRSAEEMILAGRVQLNGETVTVLGTRALADDVVTLDGRLLEAEEKRYYLLYKPRGYLSSMSDPHGEKLAVSLVPAGSRLYPVGRLDLDSEGLLLFTNDGALTLRLTHPRFEHEKEYHVLVRGEVDDTALARLQEGIRLETPDVTAHAMASRLPVGYRWRGEAAPTGQVWLRIVLTEGRKRQIRLMLQALGLRAERLIRVRMGRMVIGDLEPGQGRWLTPQEVTALRNAAGLGPKQAPASAPSRPSKPQGRERAPHHRRH